MIRAKDEFGQEFASVANSDSDMVDSQTAGHRLQYIHSSSDSSAVTLQFTKYEYVQYLEKMY